MKAQAKQASDSEEKAGWSACRCAVSPARGWNHHPIEDPEHRQHLEASSTPCLTAPATWLRIQPPGFWDNHSRLFFLVLPFTNLLPYDIAPSARLWVSYEGNHSTCVLLWLVPSLDGSSIRLDVHAELCLMLHSVTTPRTCFCNLVNGRLLSPISAIIKCCRHKQPWPRIPEYTSRMFSRPRNRPGVGGNCWVRVYAPFKFMRWCQIVFPNG